VPLQLTDPAEWAATLDALLDNVGWRLSQTGFTPDEVVAAELIPADTEMTPGRLLREQFVALRLRSGIEVHAVRGGLVIPPTGPAPR
jgi:hypothetical protein